MDGFGSDSLLSLFPKGSPDCRAGKVKLHTVQTQVPCRSEERVAGGMNRDICTRLVYTLLVNSQAKHGTHFSDIICPEV